MKLARFSLSGQQRPGVVVDDQICDLSPYCSLRGLASILATGSPGHEVVADWVSRSDSYKLSEVALLAPVDGETRTFCAALNYADHAAEADRPLPSDPLIFLKLPSNLVGPHDAIDTPPVGTYMDYEAELAVVIGRGGAQIDESAAMDHVLGLTVLNDVSARNLQHRGTGVHKTSDWFSGKALDQSTPVGPYVVTLDEAPAIADISFRAKVNGEVVQEGNTSNLLFSVPRLLSYISERVTLQPMDVIATGTPARLESARGRKLVSGDIVEIEVDGVGSLRNVVA